MSSFLIISSSDDHAVSLVSYDVVIYCGFYVSAINVPSGMIGFKFLSLPG